MINISDNKYASKERPDSELILSKISDYSIWKYYYPDLEVNQLSNSPLRSDKNPSFSVFLSNKYGRLMFKDFGNGDRGDVFIFLSKYLQLNYYEVLVRIIADFDLGDYFSVDLGSVKKTSKKSIPKIYTDEDLKSLIKESARLNVKIRDWSIHDRDYWMKYGISKSTLMKYKVLPISYIFLNDDVITASKNAYVYREYKDNTLRFKVYQPYSESMKWCSNLVEGTLSGWSQLDENGDILIIASSLKDAMCLHDLGFNNVIAPQTENYIHKEHIINHLKSRFKSIYIFYDNDSAGIKASEKMINMYNLKNIVTDSPFCKDPSDYYYIQGRDSLLECINSQL
jgi:hypothetical protein